MFIEFTTAEEATADKRLIVKRRSAYNHPGFALQRRNTKFGQNCPGGEGSPKIRVLRMATAVALVGSMALFGAGAAAAAPAPLTLRYTCSFPLIGDQSVTASVARGTSDTRVVGQATPRPPVNASATISSAVRQALGLAGATTVEGTADAATVVVAPQGDITDTVPLNVPVTGVPASGSMTFQASGTLPSHVFSRPGNAKITVGGLILHLTPRNASGGLTMLRTFDTSCELDPGQNTVLASFEILPAGESPAASGIPTAGTVSPSAPTSASASTSAPATGRATSVSPDPGASDTASGTATPTVAGAPSIASSATPSASGSAFVAPILTILGVLAAGAAAFFVWWLRHGRVDVDGPED